MQTYFGKETKEWILKRQNQRTNAQDLQTANLTLSCSVNPHCAQNEGPMGLFDIWGKRFRLCVTYANTWSGVQLLLRLSQVHPPAVPFCTFCGCFVKCEHAGSEQTGPEIQIWQARRVMSWALQAGSFLGLTCFWWSLTCAPQKNEPNPPAV